MKRTYVFLVINIHRLIRIIGYIFFAFFWLFLTNLVCCLYWLLLKSLLQSFYPVLQGLYISSHLGLFYLMRLILTVELLILEHQLSNLVNQLQPLRLFIRHLLQVLLNRPWEFLMLLISCLLDIVGLFQKINDFNSSITNLFMRFWYFNNVARNGLKKSAPVFKSEWREEFLIILN